MAEDRPPDAQAREAHERRYMVKLGLRIRAIREERGLTQQAVARSAGIATDMVSRLENGHYTSPGLRTLLRIAEGVGVSLAALLPDAPSAPSSAPESALKSRLGALAHRAEPHELDLLVDIAGVVLGRSQR
ncbi:MAG: helix-turn-helix domain-containing protein [Myxococcales bacterium]|nr:helix-turn-helix domain-containing protein [Myxococcales bacterium]